MGRSQRPNLLAKTIVAASNGLVAAVGVDLLDHSVRVFSDADAIGEQIILQKMMVMGGVTYLLSV